MSQLISINGVSYKESDIAHMIQYYQNHFRIDLSQYNNDISGEILKHFPSYPRIHKKSYQSNLFYEQYCDLDITFKEFLNYYLPRLPIIKKIQNIFKFIIIIVIQ